MEIENGTVIISIERFKELEKKEKLADTVKSKVKLYKEVKELKNYKENNKLIYVYYSPNSYSWSFFPEKKEKPLTEQEAIDKTRKIAKEAFYKMSTREFKVWKKTYKI